MNKTNLLNEFDETVEAVINPKDIITAIPSFPKVVIATFNKKMIDQLLSEEKLDYLTATSSINGDNPVYSYQVANQKIGLTMALLGASSCVGHLEELVAKGAEKLIVFGSCGVLDQRTAHSTIVIPTAAVRDEGTSYHYQPAAPEVFPRAQNVARLEEFFSAKKITYETGKTWTTDGFYRETLQKVAQRKAMGCQYVEMESAAIFAWSLFRKVDAYVFFHAADTLAGEQWDNRQSDIPENVPDFLKLAMLLATELTVENY